MASTINATSTGSGGLITTGNSVNQLELQTGDTTRVVIDSSGNVTIQGQGDLRLADSDSSHYVALQAPGTVASNVTFTLPSADGTSGQVLQTNGSGTLSFATPASGALVYLAIQTVSGTPSTVDFTTGFSSTYDDYMIVFEGVKSSLDNNELLIRLQKSASFQTTGYNYIYHEGRDTNVSAISGLGGDAATDIMLDSGNTSAANTFQSGRVLITNVNAATANACVVLTQMGGVGGATNKNFVAQSAGSQNTAAVVTGLRFRFGSGANFSSGTFRLYGVAKS